MVATLPQFVDLTTHRFKKPVNESLNILFLSEGYPASKEQEFEDLVKKISADLLKEKPFNMKKKYPHDINLEERINIWSAFIPIETVTSPSGSTANGVPIITDGTAGIPFYFDNNGSVGIYNYTKTVCDLKYKLKTWTVSGKLRWNFVVEIDQFRINQIIPKLTALEFQIGGAANPLSGSVIDRTTECVNYWAHKPNTIIVLAYDDFDYSRAQSSNLTTYITGIVFVGGFYTRNRFRDYFPVVSGSVTVDPSFRSRSPVQRGDELSTIDLIDMVWHELGHAVFGFHEEYVLEFDDPANPATASSLQGLGNLRPDLYPKYFFNVHQRKDIINPNAIGGVADAFDQAKIRWFNWNTYTTRPIIHPEVTKYLVAQNYHVDAPLNLATLPSNELEVFVAGRMPEPAESFIVTAINATEKVKGSAIIGIYEGAAGKSHNFYRSSGMCLLRSRYYVLPNKSDPKKSDRVNGNFSFCYVCKYLIVEWFVAQSRSAPPNPSPTLTPAQREQLLENLSAQFPSNKDW